MEDLDEEEKVEGEELINSVHWFSLAPPADTQAKRTLSSETFKILFYDRENILVW